MAILSSTFSIAVEKLELRLGAGLSAFENFIDIGVKPGKITVFCHGLFAVWLSKLLCLD